MSYNVLALNPGHNGSACLVIDGNIVYYSEEERLSRMKYDGNPFRAMLEILQEYHVDELILGGTSPEFVKLPWTNEDAYSALVRKFNPNIKITNMGNQHHKGHAAAAFYNSGFNEALAVVVDGAGSIHTAFTRTDNTASVSGFETESVYRCSYPDNLEPLYKKYGDGRAQYFNNGVQEFDNGVNITKAYEAVSQYLGFGFIEAGKTMGLAPYGRDNQRIPPLFVNGLGNKNVLLPYYPAGALIDDDRNIIFKRNYNPNIWHFDFSKISDIEKDLAFRVQKETQELICNLIERAVAATGINNVVISGGYGLNCVANYYYKGRLKNINLYVDPISHDGGTSIGLALLAWYEKSKSQIQNKIKTVYLGKPASYSNLHKYSNIEERDCQPADIAKLLVEQNIVALFQGRAEGGPRALGNRSILFDPRAQNGKDFVNRVKGREWFRPFAGTILEEHADSWFEMRGLKSSPFMMYAINLLPERLGQVPAVTHVDGTCRIQTVNPEENKNYYNLITEFHKLTGVPMVFNTSFNLAGEPLVETLDDAISTIQRSDIKYLYLPDIGKLITKK